MAAQSPARVEATVTVSVVSYGLCMLMKAYMGEGQAEGRCELGQCLCPSQAPQSSPSIPSPPTTPWGALAPTGLILMRNQSSWLSPNGQRIDESDESEYFPCLFWPHAYLPYDFCLPGGGPWLETCWVSTPSYLEVRSPAL